MKPKQTFAAWFTSADFKSAKVQATAKRFAVKNKIKRKKAA